MIALLLALLVAIANGATDIRTGPTGGRVDDGSTAIVEFVGPSCPNWDDEPCYVIVRPDLTWETGP